MRDKKPRWKIIRELEEKLKILTRGRREFRLILISMLEDTISLIENGEEPMLVARSVRDRGKHRYSTVHMLFTELCNYSPQLLRPHNNFNDGKIGRFTSSFYDVIKHDLSIWNDLEKYGEVGESDRTVIQKLGKLLDKFYGLVNFVVRI